MNMLRFALYSIISLSLLGYTAPVSIKSLFLILVGYVIWNFLEYGFHRGIFHNQIPEFLTYDHIRHHAEPKSDKNLFLPVKLTFPLSSLIFLIVWSVSSLTEASLVYFGLLLGYFVYEYIHYISHHSRPKNRLLKFFKHYHLKHHFKDQNSHFMVSNPLLDIIFRTL